MSVCCLVQGITLCPHSSTNTFDFLYIIIYFKSTACCNINNSVWITQKGHNIILKHRLPIFVLNLASKSTFHKESLRESIPTVNNTPLGDPCNIISFFLSQRKHQLCHNSRLWTRLPLFTKVWLLKLTPFMINSETAFTWAIVIVQSISPTPIATWSTFSSADTSARQLGYLIVVFTSSNSFVLIHFKLCIFQSLVIFVNVLQFGVWKDPFGFWCCNLCCRVLTICHCDGIICILFFVTKCLFSQCFHNKKVIIYSDLS